MLKYALVSTGGTIAMQQNALGKAVPALEGLDLLHFLPAWQQEEWDVFNYSNLPSAAMTPERLLHLSQTLRRLLEQKKYQGIVLTHGTDTLEETAFFLDLTLPSDVPVVLTAAQRDASEEDSDGPRNLANAAQVVKSGGAHGRGVLVALHTQIHGAREIRKLHTSQPDAFSSGAAGILGFVEENEVFWLRHSLPTINLPLPKRLAPVPIIKVYTGMNPAIIDFYLSQGAEAFVIEAFGRGNVPSDLVPALAKVVSDQAIPVVITSRCPFGRTAPHYGYPGGGADLEAAGAWLSGDLSSEKTRLLMTLALCQDIPVPTLKAWLRHGALESPNALS